MNDVFEDLQRDPYPTDEKRPEDRRDKPMIQNPTRPRAQHGQQGHAQYL